MQASIEMFTIICAQCGIAFSIPNQMDDNLRKSHKSFCCPMGHSQSYPHKTDEEKLQEKVKKLEDEKLALQGELDACKQSKKRTTKKKSA